MENEEVKGFSQKNEQIDFINVVNHLVKKKRVVFKFMIIFLIFGIFFAFIAPKEFSSTAIILPQISSQKGLSKKYSNIAALVGINLGQSEGNKIVPTLYPIIVAGAPFQKAILRKKINIQELDESVTIFEYLKTYKKYGLLYTIKSYTIGLPGKIINLFKSDDFLAISKEGDNFLYRYSKDEKSCIEYLDEHLDIAFNDLDGYISISATMDEPLAAAQLVKNAQDLLQYFIIDYNIVKSKDELKFIEERLEVARLDYIDKRSRLGAFRDRNKNGIRSTTSNREEQLKSEYDLSYYMYSELSSQRESAKLQVEKDTPIFTELQPALISSEPSAPNKIFIILGSLVLGVFLSVSLILYRFLLPLLKKQFQK